MCEAIFVPLKEHNEFFRNGQIIVKSYRRLCFKGISVRWKLLIDFVNLFIYYVHVFGLYYNFSCYNWNVLKR
jgi:hypothetical protein